MKKPPIINSEHQLQKAAVKLLRAHNFLCFCTDVFNGISFIKDIKKKAIYKRHMIDLGASVGQPDLIVIGKCKPVFIEFKFDKGKLSPDQIRWRDFLIANGYEWKCWRTLEECRDFIVEEMNKRNNGLQ